MVESVMHFVGAVLLTYFLSRGFRRLIQVGPKVLQLVAPHLLSFMAILLLLLWLRYSLFIFNKEQLAIYAVPQALWLVFDAYRSEIAFWRPPVVDPTEPSAKAREAGRS